MVVGADAYTGASGARIRLDVLWESDCTVAVGYTGIVLWEGEAPAEPPTDMPQHGSAGASPSRSETSKYVADLTKRRPYGALALNCVSLFFLKDVVRNVPCQQLLLSLWLSCTVAVAVSSSGKVAAVRSSAGPFPFTTIFELLPPRSPSMASPEGKVRLTAEARRAEALNDEIGFRSNLIPMTFPLALQKFEMALLCDPLRPRR